MASPHERSPMLPSPYAASSTDTRRPLPVAMGWMALVAVALMLVGLSTFDSPTSATVQDAATAVTSSFPTQPDGSRDLLSLCEEKFIAQELDHFRATGTGSFQQRYFVCSPESFHPTNGSVFFYVGNEADVTLYLNHTGLMWENAAAFNAVVVFAEHRYFGKSVPFGLDVLSHMQFLSTQQALADYAVLIETLKTQLGADVPVIGFGGSYGGMLGAWFRMKYPHIIDGVIAGSAPVVNFLGDPDHPADTEAFNRVVTFDMSEDAGAAPNCIPNLRRALKAATELAETQNGRKQLAELLHLCDADSLPTSEDVVFIAAEAYGDLAMGNYPYPTSYIMDGNVDLPGYPMRAACEPLAGDFAEADTLGLINAFRESIGVYYNATKSETCFFPSTPVATVNKSATSDEAKQAEIDQKGNFWGYLECSELYMPMSSDGVSDIFPATPVNQSQDDANCFEQWGVHLKPNWAQTEYGGMKALRAAGNIVFSNGDFDPWSGLGVLESLSPSVVAVPVPGGAHHLDLFFSHPLDPPAVIKARQTELAYIRQWIDEFYAFKQQLAKTDL
ncbi:Lysosomal Pro-X carboxypeptidase [Phytophthora fragariae]|uniref:Lysosomal Pro-X carboxypeptidase n=2 Tax=Phytophthora fragariae TaxID=53985 RepID=A0A6A3ZPQ4_9STRA|nr:Lysosomal Pro-X carboxypeptidase [Phytophthora fragariae]KAE9237628.1 Lysosomal Pro-X carboxypeptidase [Phytophthora fragariae]